jgi:hypothetical protein
VLGNTGIGSKAGGLGGAGSGGDHDITGQPGFSVIAGATDKPSGQGGGEGGGRSVLTSGNTFGVAGVDGGGGSGGADEATNGRTGGAGGVGYVIVWEYK